jgi:hypothetical protein
VHKRLVIDSIREKVCSTYRGRRSLCTPNTTLNGDLDVDAEQFTTIGGALAPSQKHFLHLALRCGIDLGIDIEE